MQYNYCSYTVNLAWLQPSRRDSQWVKYFKLVILNVQFGSVFLKPITYFTLCRHCYYFFMVQHYHFCHCSNVDSSLYSTSFFGKEFLLGAAACHSTYQAISQSFFQKMPCMIHGVEGIYVVAVFRAA